MTRVNGKRKICMDMKLTIEFFSILSDWVGVSEAQIELPTGATYGDVLEVIGREYRPNMPAQLWDHHAGGFTSRVMATRNGVRIAASQERLADGDRVRFWPMMGGG